MSVTGRCTKMAKISEMVGVREYAEGFPVALWRDEETGRLVVVAENEGGNNSTAVDLLDLIGWLRSGDATGGLDGGDGTISIGVYPAGDGCSS